MIKEFHRKPSLELREMIEQKNSYGTQVCFFLGQRICQDPHYPNIEKFSKISVDRAVSDLGFEVR